MAATEGIVFNGTTFSFSPDGTTYTPAFELTSIGDIGETGSSIDMSHSTSPDNRKEFLPGMIEGKSVSIEGNYSRVDAGKLETNFNTVKFCRVTLSNGDKFDFKGILEDYSHTGSVGDKMTFTASLKPTTKVDFVAGT